MASRENSTHPNGGENDLILPDWAWEKFEYLCRSKNRIEVLSALSDHPQERHRLEETVDIPRSTLSRTLKEMQSLGWVNRYSNTEYGVTPAGDAFLTFLNQTISTCKSIAATAEAYCVLPDELVEQYGGLFVEDICEGDDDVIQLTRSNASNPYKSMYKFKELLREYNPIRLLITAPNNVAYDAVMDTVAGSDFETFYVSETVKEDLKEWCDNQSRETSPIESAEVLTTQPRFQAILTPLRLILEGLTSVMQSKIVVDIPLTDESAFNRAIELFNDLPTTSATQ